MLMFLLWVLLVLLLLLFLLLLLQTLVVLSNIMIETTQKVDNTPVYWELY